MLPAADVFPGATWQTKTPEEVGLDSAKLAVFAADVGGRGCIVRDGYMVYTWGTQTTKSDWASAAKPVTSTMLMFALKEGKIGSVDALVNPYVQSVYGTNLSAKDQTMTFRHLANMVSGYALPENPGAAWGYNDYAISLYNHTLFDGVYQQTPNTAATAATRLGALQFQDGTIYSSRGGYGISTTPRDFARIGWFWLKKGNWNGTQLLPANYFDTYRIPQVAANLPRTTGGTNDYIPVGTMGGGTDQTVKGPGIYGFNWWHNPGQSTWPAAPADTFQANGHWNGEVVTVIPSLNMVACWIGSGDNVDTFNVPMNTSLQKLVAAVSAPASEPLPGQVMVDPNNPRFMVRNQDLNSDGKLDPVYISGPGDPEGFLYRGTRNADGTRSGDQAALITKMTGTGANCAYMHIVHSSAFGGDGAADASPFNTPGDPDSGVNSAILDQWETWFTQMDNAGIVVHLFFYDDNINVATAMGWPMSGGNLHSNETAFINTVVNRFEHHKNLVWVVMEEIGEMGGDYIAHGKKIAETIRAADSHKHVIGVHKNEDLTFNEFADDPNIDQFLIQYNVSTADILHNGMVTAWTNATAVDSANGRYSLNMAEAAGHGTGASARKKDWAIAMGGASVMRLGMDIAGTPVADLQNSGKLAAFMADTNYNVMAPHDELKSGGTQYVLALPGDSYIAYASALSGNIGLTGLTAGTYSFRWFDCVNGTTVNQTGVSVSAGTQSWAKPGSIGIELAVWIKRTGGAGNIAPTAINQNVTVLHNTAKAITLTYTDPDSGPGPYTFTIVAGPTHGTLTGSGANRTYTPTSGYSGPDSFTFHVNDGLADSNVATISLTVQSNVNQAPVANNQSASTAQNTAVTISLSFTDPDGPGPNTFTITQQPANGMVTHAGNDATYTPNAGYTGADSFQWQMNDGLADSNIATVSMTVTAVDLNAGRVAHWAFDEGAGTTAADSSGNGHTGTLTNGPTWVAGQVNGGVQFDGVNDTVAAAGAFTPAVQGSVVFWMNPTRGGVRQRILGGHDAFEITIEADNRLSHQLYAASSDTLNATTPVTLNAWVHVVCTYDSGTTESKIYFNGALQVSGNKANDAPGNLTFTMGTRTGAADFFQGVLDDVRIYNRVLSDTEIATLAGGAPPVNQPPSANAGPDQSVTLPALAALDGTVSDPESDPLTTLWTKASGPGTVTFGNAASVDTSASFSAAGSYVLQLSANDGGHPAVTDSVTITVAPAPNQPPVLDSDVTATPNPVVNQNTTSLFVTAHDPDSGPQPLTYDWSKISGPGTVNFSPDGTTAAATTTATFGASGTYTLQVSVSDSAAAVTSSITLDVTLPPTGTAPSITAQPANQTVTEPATATFTVTATGTAPLSYQWQKNGTNIAGATASSYTTPATVLADSGATFRVIVTNGFGSVTSSTATLTVNPVGSTLTAAASGTPTSGTAPLTVNFTGSATGGTGGGGGSGAFLEAGGIVVMEAENFTGNLIRTDPHGTAWVTQSATAGHVGDGYVNTAIPAPNTNGSWSNAAEVSYDIEFATAGTYVIWMRCYSVNTATNSAWVGHNGTQIGATFDNSDADLGAWVWRQHGTAVAVAAGARTFQVRRREAGYLVDRIVLTKNGDTPAGNGPAESARGGGGGGSYTYSWNFGDGSPVSTQQNPAHTYAAGNYTATLTVSDGVATDNDTVAITVTVAGTAPSITAQPTNQTVTEPATATFSVTATGTAPLSYQWQKNGANIGGATASSYTTPATTTADSGATYRVIVTNGFGSATSSAATLTVNPTGGALTVTINTVASGKAYLTGTLAAGQDCFIDRAYTFKSPVPAAYDGQPYIRTANEDKTNQAASFLTFTVNQDVTVYVAYDTRASSLPTFLATGWTNTGVQLATTDVTRNVFSKNYAAGAITLGGNHQGGNTGAASMYNVIVAPLGGGAGAAMAAQQNRAAAMAVGGVFSATDRDGDGLTDAFELQHGLNPYSIDSDGNGTVDEDEYTPSAGSPTYTTPTYWALQMSGASTPRTKSAGCTLTGATAGFNSGWLAILVGLIGLLTIRRRLTTTGC